MFKILKINIFAAVLFLTFYMVSNASEGFSSFAELMEKGKDFNGKNIILTGEAIEKTLNRGEYSRVNITDGTLSIGVWMKAYEADKITLFGDYKHKGDIIEVNGVFNKSCSEHVGTMDIHAFSIKVVDNGYYFKENVDKLREYMAIGLSVLTICLGCLYLKFRK